jgi:hypothetical protein
VRQTSALMWTLFLCLSAFLIDARAGEQLYDDTHCFAGTSAMVFRSKELTVLSYELRGITRSNLVTGDGVNLTSHCVGVVKVAAGERTENGYCKFMAPNEDFTIREYSRMGAGNPVGHWKTLHGTGTWQGVSGKGTFQAITKGKPITKGTFQNCSQWKGTFHLPD